MSDDNVVSTKTVTDNNGMDLSCDASTGMITFLFLCSVYDDNILYHDRGTWQQGQKDRT